MSNPKDTSAENLVICDFVCPKENNLLNSVYREQGCVYLDENDPNPERRYKMTYQALEERDGRMQGRTALAVSKDGFHWNREAYSNDILPFTSDSPNYILYDKLIHKYIVFPRPGHLDRRVAICLSKDCENWDGPYVVIEPKDIQNHFYYLAPMQYEGMYVGFIPVFKPQEYELDLACKMAGPRDIELCYSPNGIGWERIQVGEAFLPHGELGEWDAGGAYPMSAIEVGKEIRLYYIGMFRQHGCFLKENRGHELGVATLRRDGFISLDAGEEQGSVTTRLISSWPPAEDSLKQLGWLQWIDWKKGELRVNVQTDKGGYLKAELLDDHWHIIEGYSRRESIPIAGDHIDTIVRWRQKDVIKPLKMLFRVRLIIKNAKLYSLSFG